MLSPALRDAAIPGGVLAPGSRWTRAAGPVLQGVLVLGVAALVALLAPEQLALAVAGVVATLLVLARPLAGVALLLIAVPFGSIAEVEVGTLTIGAVEPLVALLLVSWTLRGVRHRRLSLRGGPVAIACVPLIGLMLLSITYAISAGPAIKETLKWMELLIVLLVVADMARDRANVSWLLAALLAAGAAEGLSGVFQVATGSGPAEFAVGGALRAFGDFGQPNPYAGYLATIVPLAALLVITPEAGKRLRIFAALAALCLLAGILLSQSRGAWLGLGIAGLVLMVVWSRRTRALLVPASGVAVLALVAAAAGLLPQALVGRLGQVVEYFGVFDVQTVDVTPENFAVVERMAHWQAGWLMFLDNPWLGVGAGNYPDAYPQYYLQEWVNPLGHAHNYYLNTLAELGVVGLALLLVFLWAALRSLFGPLVGSKAGQGDPFWRAVQVGVACGFVVFLTHNLFDNLFVHGVYVQLGFFFGLAAVATMRLQPRSPLGAPLLA